MTLAQMAPSVGGRNYTNYTYSLLDTQRQCVFSHYFMRSVSPNNQTEQRLQENWRAFYSIDMQDPEFQMSVVV